jgi:hypothetical protein
MGTVPHRPEEDRGEGEGGQGFNQHRSLHSTPLLSALIPDLSVHKI